ncbi:hypothetical protein ENUP19_0361G0024 [Entamoeba nuttalli]|uniref:Uncharacterized protein n=2 Tax=Entamoeba nuttalli TaxID=412467 RepID=K2G4T0_ENTNP|nr:hypothetical protein ENU1_201330 [Entamoeba nuttalli P19]EKE37321.1 hypothetical protein ENU1_201330 [Entamoeba nuttalli P19]|eukprot:XP_008860343.1 hypothetical protein ENU1_201330 [Entamoeba nuttalli P19]
MSDRSALVTLKWDLPAHDDSSIVINPYLDDLIQTLEQKYDNTLDDEISSILKHENLGDFYVDTPVNPNKVLIDPQTFYTPTL